MKQLQFFFILLVFFEQVLEHVLDLSGQPRAPLGFGSRAVLEENVQKHEETALVFVIDQVEAIHKLLEHADDERIARSGFAQSGQTTSAISARTRAFFSGEWFWR